MDIRPVGATGALCTLGGAISEQTGAAVAALAAAVREARLPGFVEAVPGYTALLVRYDPLITDFDAVSRGVEALRARLAEAALPAGRTVEIPVCYGGAYGPDLPDVAAHAGLSPAEVVAIHCSRAYRVYMIGFLPGFPYLGGLDPRIHTPRRESPRARVPAGSVGIGGQQTGVYPMESPGGWQIIGRTPAALFVPGQPPKYGAGDFIRFIPIPPEQYEEAARTWR